MFTSLIAQIPPVGTVAGEAPLPAAALPVGPDLSIWHHVLQSDPLVKFALIILVGFSVGCWAVILYKLMQLGSAQRSTQGFWQKFLSAGTIAEVVASKKFRASPAYEIFLTGNEALAKVKKITRQLTSYHRGYLEQRMRSVQEDEMLKLEQYVSFLATTASVAPFIGLFGTVWGILMAFLAIGKAGSSSLATVGPYIAEALVATAVGLFAAIPAVVGYNFFVGQIRVIGKTVDLFVEEFLLRSEKEVAA